MRPTLNLDKPNDRYKSYIQKFKIAVQKKIIL